MGSLEDLSHMMHPSVIASRLYNAFSNGNGSSPKSSAADSDSDAEDRAASVDQEQQEGIPGKNTAVTSIPKKRHRSKRSHMVPCGGTEELNNHANDATTSDWEEKEEAEPFENDSIGADVGARRSYQDFPPMEIYEEHKAEDAYEEHEAEDAPSPEEMAYAMEHPF